MKNIIYISLLMFSPVILLGQEKVSPQNDKGEKIILKAEDTKEKQPALKEISGSQTSASDSTITNKNMRGERMQKMRKKMMDNFMDKDGDGINDCRTKGMGWSGKGKHKGFGRHGK